MLDNVRLTLVLSKCVSLTESIIANQGRHCLCGAEISLFVAIRLHAIHLCQIPWHWAQVAFIWTKDNMIFNWFQLQDENLEQKSQGREEQGEMRNADYQWISRTSKLATVKVFLEEWLTDYRAKLMRKCKILLKVSCVVYTKPTAVLWMHLYRSNTSHTQQQAPTL